MKNKRKYDRYLHNVERGRVKQD